jgi:polysaccharide export outer membrane protein
MPPVLAGMHDGYVAKQTLYLDAMTLVYSARSAARKNKSAWRPPLLRSNRSSKNGLDLGSADTMTCCERQTDCNKPLRTRRAEVHMTLMRGRKPVTTILALITVALVAQAADLHKPTYASSNAPEYRLGPEDVIDVFVWKEPELSTTVVIRPDGRISLPLTNEIDASGKTAVQLQREITEKLREYVAQPVVSVMVKQVNSLKISVLGEVRRPDVYRIKNRVTVLDAIAMAGGFSDLAKRSKVVVLRNAPSGPQRIKVNVKELVTDDSRAPFYLQSQDTVYVE